MSVSALPKFEIPFMAGKQNTKDWYFFFGALSGGVNATIATSPLSVGGQAGSMTFVNGILTAQTPAT
jgi:hypothetical protein